MIPINAISFLEYREHEFILDVRTPAEFSKGHIPGAINFPLFENEERAEVGTIYKQESPEAAMIKGLEIVGPKMASFVTKATEILKDKKALIHCWRGGKRSQSVSWLLNNAGFQTTCLKGGYKAYRKAVKAKLRSVDPQFLVLGGKTGCGKTLILHELLKNGEQVIDLEGLANHKGSAFGWIGEHKQPSIEQFENDLWHRLSQMDLDKVIWLENESRSIGSVYLPDGFWEKMKSSTLINIEVPDQYRIKNLVNIYSMDNKEELCLSFGKIKKRLGIKNHDAAVEMVKNGQFAEAVSLALKYYDKTYSHLLAANETPHQIIEKFEVGDPTYISEQLISIRKKINDRKGAN